MTELDANHDAHAEDDVYGHDHDHEPYIEDYFLATTTSVTRLTPSMIRVTLDVIGGERLVASGHPDEWVRLALQPNLSTPVTLPVLMANGKWGRPDGSKHCPNRPYTIRKWNAATNEMVIDIVVHEGGVAAGWAMRAKVGDVVGICNPEGRLHIPRDSRWILLLTDITRLPAVGRILEELPKEFQAVVHVEVPTEADQQDLVSRADVAVHWHVYTPTKELGASATQLANVARNIAALPDGPGCIYIAGEAKAASECRKHFRDTLGFDKSRIDAVGYWIEGQARV